MTRRALKPATFVALDVTFFLFRAIPADEARMTGSTQFFQHGIIAPV